MKILIPTQTSSMGAGGNQFLNSLKKYFKSKNLLTNQAAKASIVLFNSHHDIPKVRELTFKHADHLTFYHRLDGLFEIYNTPNDPRQQVALEANSDWADYSIFQSKWAALTHITHYPSYFKDKTSSCSIIYNGVDTSIFKFTTKSLPVIGEKTRIITTSWSSNKNKGREYINTLASKLPGDKFEFICCGPEDTTEYHPNVKVIPAVTHEELNQLYEQSHIFLSGAKYEACSNAILEAQACGLPVLGYNSGSTPELISKSGILFDNDNIMEKLVELLDNYNNLHNNIQVRSIEHAGNQYIRFFNE